ncbi:MAG: hypothetical protein ACKV2T_06940 [Kofleriaceae bacterium]
MYTRLVMAAACLVSACELSDSERVASACTAICRCEAAPLPTLQDRCIAECTEEIGGGVGIPDDCLACISGNDSCATIERDCEPVCNPPDPPEPVFADAL